MELVKIAKETGRVCAYCGKEITNENDLTLDHVIPVSKGGKDSSENLVIACKACNSEKANLDVNKYAHFLNIMNSLAQNNDNDFMKETISGLKILLKNFNDELKEIKKRKSYLEKKRLATLESMMYDKFNVIRGYDFAKKLRDMTEELYNINLTASQMNMIAVKLNAAFAFLNNIEPENIKKSAMKEMRNSVIANYYTANHADDPQKEQPSLPELIEKSENIDSKAQ